MTQLLEKVKSALEHETDLAGHSVSPEVSEFQKMGISFKAKTDLRTGRHNYEYNPRYADSNGEEKFFETVRDLPKHEINHHKYKGCIGCPQTVDKSHDLFFLPAYEILSEKGFSEEDVDYLTNALQDTILHRDLRVHQGFRLEGMVNFFEDQGYHSKRESADRSRKRAKKLKFSDFYEAHVKLNMFLWGNKQQKKKLKRFYSHSQNVNEVLRRFLDRVGHLKGSENPYLDFLDESDWEAITKIYAQEFSELMTPGYALPLINHSGAGTRGRESEPHDDEGNIFQKQRRTNRFKKARVMKANSRGEPAHPWISSYEAMDLLYSGLAEKIILKAETFTNPEQMPIVWFGKRPFNPKDNLKQTTFGFSDRGKFELKKRRYHIDTPTRAKSSPRSFPEIKFGLFDVSGSMTQDILGGNNIGNTNIIPWGDNSKYHWGIMLEYGILEYLRQNHLLQQNTISGAFFGEDTVVVNGLNELKKRLLNSVFERDTQIGFEEVKRFFSKRGNLLYTISDGIIGNWGKIRDDYINLAKNHCYVHLHMGTPNIMTNNLEENNLLVVYGEDGKGIVQKVIYLTDNLFRQEGGRR